MAPRIAILATRTRKNREAPIGHSPGDRHLWPIRRDGSGRAPGSLRIAHPWVPVWADEGKMNQMMLKIQLWTIRTVLTFEIGLSMPSYRRAKTDMFLSTDVGKSDTEI